jgi:hypothetical protein
MFPYYSQPSTFQFPPLSQNHASQDLQNFCEPLAAVIFLPNPTQPPSAVCTFSKTVNSIIGTPEQTLRAHLVSNITDENQRAEQLKNCLFGLPSPVIVTSTKTGKVLWQVLDTMAAGQKSLTITELDARLANDS